MTDLLDLPPMSETAEPVILPGFLSGLGLTPHLLPAWATDPDFLKSVELGLVDIPEDLIGESK